MAGLLVQIVAACFSVGYHHPDEHFQILEFCNYKLGYSTAKELPWEFATYCRSSILPLIAVAVSRGLGLVGMYSPFTVMLLLRLVMAVLTWWVTCRMIAAFGGEFETRRGRSLYVASSFVLWFVPYLGVRFSSENVAAILFFLALTMLWKIKEDTKASFTSLFVAGLLLGLTVFVRLQMGFAFVGLAAWLLFVRKLPIKRLLITALGAIVSAGIAICLDRLFYGVWVLTPFEYFSVNILQNKAASFGTTPWWDYFWLFFQYAVPPLSIGLLVGFGLGVYKKPKHLLSFVAITMILGHMVVGHKEMRFLFPLIYAFVFLFCQGMEVIITRYGTKKWYKPVLSTLVGVNVIMLAMKMFMPAQESVNYYSYIYRFSQKHRIALLAIEKSPYNMDRGEELTMNFYKPRGLNMTILQNERQLDGLAKNDSVAYLLLSKKIIPSNTINNHRIERVYSIFPNWLLRFNFFDWQARSNLWVIYRVYL